MKKNELRSLARNMADKLMRVDFNNLPISDYNKQYVSWMYPALPFYMEIFADCIFKGIESAGLSPSEISLIDYGGGSGFLSILAKEANIKEVIYIDRNAYCVEKIKILKMHLGIGPDIILHGNSDALADWCEARKVKPQVLIATDLIEHVYNLELFFSHLCRINPSMQMLFTTASNPYNPVVKRRLHRFMTACESGTAVSPNYYTRREKYIREQYPNLSDEQLKAWSQCTRGLTYEDIRKAIDGNRLPIPADKYNTCDPETGNWAERILPIRRYRQLLEPNGYKLTVEKGFYNTHRNNFMASCFFRCLNTLIRCTGKAGLLLAPYIILHGRSGNI